MSKWGRAQDALHDILFGFEGPDPKKHGLLKWYPGPLNGYPIEKRSELIEQIITAVTNIFSEDDEQASTR